MNKTHVIIETTAFFLCTVLISSMTILGALGVDPFLATETTYQHREAQEQ
jgi:hypothetical protein